DAHGVAADGGRKRLIQERGGEGIANGPSGGERCAEPRRDPCPALAGGGDLHEKRREGGGDPRRIEPAEMSGNSADIDTAERPVEQAGRNAELQRKENPAALMVLCWAPAM
ncbi:MAG TPA: hypothetical protein PKA64_08610, partial [Myxococcota bacterium]|nr:hypothetical protein [Myxococcota bacterium]